MASANEQAVRDNASASPSNHRSTSAVTGSQRCNSSATDGVAATMTTSPAAGSLPAQPEQPEVNPIGARSVRDTISGSATRPSLHLNSSAGRSVPSRPPRAVTAAGRTGGALARFSLPQARYGAQEITKKPGKRINSHYKSTLEYSHGLAQASGSPASSPCPFCISFGREIVPLAVEVQTGSSTEPNAQVSPPVATNNSAVTNSSRNSPAEEEPGESDQASADPHDPIVPSQNPETNEPNQRKPRRPTTTVLYFSDFSKHRIEKHYRTCHPKKWNAYKKALLENGLSRETNLSFFSREKITAHFARRSTGSSAVKIPCCIGKLSIMLFSKEPDYDARTKTGIVLCYGDKSVQLQQNVDLSAAEKSSLHYVATISSVATFEHAIYYVSRCLSFSQISDVIARERDMFSEARKLLTYVHRGEAARFTRLVAVIALNSLSCILKSSWTYSLAADASAQIMGTAYFNIMVRIPPLRSDDDIQALHLIAPPIQGSHTGSLFYDTTKTVLDVVDPQWQQKIIGSTSDGAANMMGPHSGWQTRLNDASLEAGETMFFQNHCGPHQLNLITGKAIAALESTGSRWMSKLTEIIKYTRKESNLIEDMGSQSPYYIEVRWTSLETVLLWYRRHMDKLECHYTAEDKELAEDTSW